MRNPNFRIIEKKNKVCTLRFKTSQPAGEALDLRCLLRFREPISRSKRTIRGKVPDAIQNCMHHGESFNEVKAHQILVASAHADIFQVQPFELIYYLDGKRRRYYPDVMLVFGDEIWIVEIKTDEKADDPEEKKRFELIKKLLATHRFHFLLWRKSSICAEPRLANTRLMLRYQIYKIPPVDRERVRRMFVEAPETSIGALSQQDLFAALRLVIEGFLYIDWWSPLCRQSLIGVEPIGSQEWPSRVWRTERLKGDLDG